MLRARVRASVEIYFQAGHLFAELSDEPFDYRRELLLGRRHRVVAMRIADTSDGGAVEAVGADREPDFADPRENLVEPRARNSGEDKVLAARQPDIAADIRCDRGELTHLLPAHQAEIDRESHVEQSRLRLLMDSHVIALAVRQRQFSEIFEFAFEPLFDQFAERLDAVIVDHELEPRLYARDPVFGRGLPDVDNRAQDGNHFGARDEDSEMARETGRRGLAATDAHGKALPIILARRDQRDAVNLRRVALKGTRRNRNLVLARQIGIIAIPVEKARRFRDMAGHIEQLV